MGRKALLGLWEQLSFLLSKSCKCQSLCRENWVTSQWELEAVWVEDFVRNCQEAKTTDVLKAGGKTQNSVMCS